MSLLDEPLRSYSPPPSPSLIVLDIPAPRPPRPTLLDSTTEEDKQVRWYPPLVRPPIKTSTPTSDLRPTAAVFVPRPKPVCRDSSVTRQTTRLPAPRYAAPPPPAQRTRHYRPPSAHRHRNRIIAPRPRAFKPSSPLYLSPPSSPSSPSSPDLHSYLSSRSPSPTLSTSTYRSRVTTKTYSDRSISPSPVPDLVQSTDLDYTPTSSFSSRHPTPTDDNEGGIIITAQKDLQRLFKLDRKPFSPIPTASGRLDGGDHPKQPLLIEFADENSQGRNSGITESLIDIIDEPVIASKNVHPESLTLLDGLQEQTEGEDLLVDLSVNNMSGTGERISTGVVIMQPHISRDGEGSLVDMGTPVDRRSRDLQTLRKKIGIKASPVGPSTSRTYGIESPYKLMLSPPSPRSNIPYDLTNPNPPDALQSSMMRSWAQAEPSDAHKAYVSKTLEDMSYMINSRLGWPGSSTSKNYRRFEVDIFGSVSWGGETGTSGDLDLVILDREMPQGYHPSTWRVPPGEPVVNSGRGPKTPFRNLPRVYKLWDLAHALEQLGMTGCQPIVGASTPIVKFKDVRNGRHMEFDVNVNDLGGWYNSSLILHYCLLSPHVLRPMIHALKLWAAAFNLNDPSGSRGPATMSSYCLTLMAIGYLQHRGVLPNLQANVKVKHPADPARVNDPDVIWVSWGKEQGIKAHIGFSKTPPPGWKNKEPGLTAADALRGFFAYLKPPGNYDYRTKLISILQGGVVTRAHEQGAENREEDTKRRELRALNYPEEVINRDINYSREMRFAEEAYMGKGDQGIQPRNWGERMIVVQDPFLWQKNCAGQMSKDGTARFMAAIDHTNDVLRSKSVATLDDVIYNPSPMPAPTPRRRGGGPRSGTPSSRGSTPSRGSRGRASAA